MELASTQAPNQDNPTKLKQSSPKVNSEKLRRSKPHRDTTSLGHCRGKRRRTVADGDDFNVNFSKIKICESNRVLRSKARNSNPSSFESVCNVQNCSQLDTVSKDHSYSKASKRPTKLKDHSISAPTINLKVFIDLASSEENSYDHLKETSKEADPLPIGQHFYRRHNDIEIIDFDDLELSNSCCEDHSSKSDRNSNDPAAENRNLTIRTVQSKNNNVSDENCCQPQTVEDKLQESDNETVFEKLSDYQSGPTEDSDRSFNPKTDFEKLLAKYGDADLYLTRNTSFLEQSHWMLESAVSTGSEIEHPGNEDISQSPVYLDLDQNRIRSSPENIATISQTGTGPTNFSSGGCFQRVEAVVTSTVTRPVVPEYYEGVASISPSNGPSFASNEFENSMSHRELPIFTNSYESSHLTKPTPSLMRRSSPSNGFPNFQTVFAHKIASLIRSKPSPQSLTNTNQSSQDDPSITNNFSTSGGSIERIFSPVIPKQPSALKKYPGIAVPFPEKDSSATRLATESTQFDNQNGQQPECRIHLVDTPPSFTRASQPEEIQIMSRPQSNGGQHFASMAMQSTRSESSRLNGCQQKTPNKPKRTRRTRAQMEIYRQEMARTCNHRNKRSQRFASRTSSHILGRNFSMEYRRVHTHPEEFLYGELPTRFPLYMRHQGLKQQRYSETYSVNQTNLFGVSTNADEWTQPFDSFPTFSHGLAEFRSFEPLWTLDSGMRNLSSFASAERMNTGDPYQDYHEPPMGSLQSPSSVMWNQQVRSVQSAYANVQQVPVGNSRLLSTERRPFTPWHQSMGATLEQLSSNMSDVTTNGPIIQMQYY